MTEHWMNIDFDDEIQRRPDPVTPADIRAMLETCARMGCTGVVWRCTTLGRADYRSRIMDRADLPFDEADYARQAAAGAWDKFLLRDRAARGLPDFRALRLAYIAKSRAILAACDPPAVARAATRALGLRLALWLDLFDEFAPGLGSRFLREHPDCQWTSRDGRRFYEGLRCYGFPAAREHQLSVVAELAEYQPDLLYFCTSCHSRHKARPGEDDGYGFEAPVVARYRERYGADIRREPFDTAAWHRVKGEGFSEFIGQAAGLLKARGIGLMLPAPIGGLVVQDNPLWSNRAAAAWSADWPLWAEQGWADILVLGEYQPMWGAAQSAWRREAAAALDVSEDDVETAAARQALTAVRGRCRIVYFSGWMGDPAQRMADVAAALRAAPLDGAMWHELASFESLADVPRLPD